MATEVERLIVTLEANIKQYERALAKAQAVTVSELRKIEGAIKENERRQETIWSRIGANTAKAFSKNFAGSLSRQAMTSLGTFFTVRFVLESTRGAAAAGDKSAQAFMDAWDKMFADLQLKVGRILPRLFPAFTGPIPGPNETVIPRQSDFPLVHPGRVPVGLAGTIEQAAREFAISAQLITEVMRKESNFKPGAISPAGAEGLMQLMPATAERLGVTDSFDIRQNIFGGAKLLRQLADQFNGDVEAMLIAYNAGPQVALRFLKANREWALLPKETQEYVETITRRLRAAKLLAGGKVQDRISPERPGAADEAYNRTESIINDLTRRYEEQQGRTYVDPAYDQAESNIAYLTRLFEEQQKQMETTTDAANAYTEALGQMAASAVSGLVNDLMNGVEAGEAFSNMLRKLASQLVDMALQNLFSFGGAPGGLFGQLFGGGLAKMQHGGRFAVGGSGGTDSKLVAFRATPGEVIDVTPRGKMRAGRGGGGTFAPSTSITVNGNMDEQMYGRVARMIEVNNQRQRQALHRDFGAVQANYQLMRGP